MIYPVLRQETKLLWVWFSLLLIITITSVVYHYGYENGKAEAKKEYLAKATTQVLNTQSIINQATGQYHTFKAEQTNQQRGQHERYTKIIRKPIYIHDCFDADGMRLLNSTIHQTKHTK